MTAVILASIQQAEAATWTTINGRVLTQTGTPVCAMVLANGQHMFSCDGAGNYTLNVPLDSNDRITLQVFASGFAPYRQTLTAGQATGFNVSMERDTTGRAFTITHNESPTSRPGWVLVTGNINYNGTPLCAMILINGQSMFSCNQSLGQYSLEVPRDSNGRITLQAFAAGFMPHRDTFGVNDPPIATGQCDSTFQAVTYSGVLTATDPEATPLTYALIDPADGTPAGNGPITTVKGGTVEITDPTTGIYEYLPNPAVGGYRGMDTFQFQVTDSGQGNLSSKATETIIVNQTVMPLGDSITSGTGSSTVELERTGYRRDLQDTLAAAGYTVRLTLERVDTVHGLLYLGLRRGLFPLGSEAREVVEAFTTQAAVALESARYLDDLRRHWRVDRTWDPRLDAAARDAMYRGWLRAVERSLGWIE